MVVVRIVEASLRGACCVACEKGVRRADWIVYRYVLNTIVKCGSIM
jgi:hypothetical protein